MDVFHGKTTNIMRAGNSIHQALVLFRVPLHEFSSVFRLLYLKKKITSQGTKQKLRFCVCLLCEKKKATALHDIDLQLHALVQCFICHSVNSQVFYFKQKTKHS